MPFSLTCKIYLNFFLVLSLFSHFCLCWILLTHKKELHTLKQKSRDSAATVPTFVILLFQAHGLVYVAMVPSLVSNKQWAVAVAVADGKNGQMGSIALHCIELIVLFLFRHDPFFFCSWEIGQAALNIFAIRTLLFLSVLCLQTFLHLWIPKTPLLNPWNYRRQSGGVGIKESLSIC